MRKEASQPFGGSPRKSQERPDKKETGEEQILGVPAGKEFDYVAKYQAGAAVETCPADVPPAVMQAAGELALRTHRALGLEVYSRTDMILDKDGNLWVLEANSLPGMTPNSFVPKEAAAVGMSYNQLCEEIVRLSCDVKRRG